MEVSVCSTVQRNLDRRLEDDSIKSNSLRGLELTSRACHYCLLLLLDPDLTVER